MENALKFCREKAGLSQADLAMKASLSKRTIQNIENHGMKPNLRTLEQLAEALGVPVTYLI